jgi:hypothetical protein
MPDAFSFDLRVIDVDGRFIVDPNIFVRVTNEVRTVTVQVAFDAAMVPLRFDDRPAGMVLQLRVTPSRYHDARIFCQVDGKGSITPPEIRVPRRSAEWLPEFDTWQSLGGVFDMLKEKLEVSRAFRLGRASEAEHFVEDAYDAVSPDDESRSLAKMSLLNLYSRLGIETAPGSATPWFSFVDNLCYATRERFLAEIEEECWSRVKTLTREPRGGYRGINVVPAHIRNFEAIPGVSGVSDAFSVKTRDAKANLQLTVARATKDGRPVFLLDSDMDENGRLILHGFDVIRHSFNGGTHPIDISESLRVMFPSAALGYGLAPKRPVPETRVRLVS